MNKEKNISVEQIESIEKYLDNSMNLGERKEFEKKLAEDIDFRQEFEEFKSMILGIEAASLKARLDSYHDEMDKTENLEISNQEVPKKTSDSKFLIFAIAASILLIMGVFIYNQNNTQPYQKIFAQHFVPDSGLPTKMGSSSNYEFYDGMVDYKRKKYNDAIEKWSSLQKSDINNDTLNYFIGVAYLANGDEQSAQKYLIQATNNNNGTFINETYYYLGLAYLKSNKPQEAKNNLEKSKLAEAKKIISEISE